MKKAVWLSYDLSIKGDYEGLYSWLDDQNAKECGDSLAFFNFDIKKDEHLADKLKQEIENSVSLSKRDRIYIIYRDDNNKLKGTFLFGGRKSAPWTGYGIKQVVVDEDF